MAERYVLITLGTEKVKARVVSENNATVHVELPNGKIVKRHKTKHIIREL